MYASKYGYTKVVELLLEQEGIDVNAQDYKGKTALIKATKNNCIPTVQLLLKYVGTDIAIEDSDGNSAVNYAVLLGNEDIFEMITKKKKK